MTPRRPASRRGHPHDGRTSAMLMPALICLVVIVSVTATVLVRLPAGRVTPWFARMTNGRVLLTEATGSLWHGSAAVTLSAGGDANAIDGPAQSNSANGAFGTGATSASGELADTLAANAPAAMQLPNRVEWRTGFWPLWEGELRMDFHEQRPLAQPVRLRLTWGGITLDAGGLDVPASVLRGLGAPFNTLDMQGAVRIEWTEWRWLAGRSSRAGGNVVPAGGPPGGTGGIGGIGGIGANGSGAPAAGAARNVVGTGGAYGQATILLRDMSSRIARVRPLGSYRMQISAVGDMLTLRLGTDKGPLRLTGSGTASFAASNRRSGAETIPAPSGFHFNGEATVDPDAPSSLASLLPLLGRPLAPDRVAFGTP